MSELLKKRKKLTEPEVRYYIIQLIGSIKYLHENLVIHRDLKLGNLFLDSQMRIKVGDFGLATKLTDISDRRKTFCGTPNYIGKYIDLLYVAFNFHFCFISPLILNIAIKNKVVVCHALNDNSFFPNELNVLEIDSEINLQTDIIFYHK